jgi:hypothetical protein
MKPADENVHGSTDGSILLIGTHKKYCNINKKKKKTHSMPSKKLRSPMTDLRNNYMLPVTSKNAS